MKSQRTIGCGVARFATCHVKGRICDKAHQRISNASRMELQFLPRFRACPRFAIFHILAAEIYAKQGHKCITKRLC